MKSVASHPMRCFVEVEFGVLFAAAYGVAPSRDDFYADEQLAFRFNSTVQSWAPRSSRI